MAQIIKPGPLGTVIETPAVRRHLGELGYNPLEVFLGHWRRLIPSLSVIGINRIKLQRDTPFAIMDPDFNNGPKTIRQYAVFGLKLIEATFCLKVPVSYAIHGPSLIAS